jgi:hypothetical protein
MLWGEVDADVDVNVECVECVETLDPKVQTKDLTRQQDEDICAKRIHEKLRVVASGIHFSNCRSY